MFDSSLFKELAQEKLIGHWKKTMAIYFVSWLFYFILLAAVFFLLFNLETIQFYIENPNIEPPTTLSDILFRFAIMALIGLFSIANAFFALNFLKDAKTGFAAFFKRFPYCLKGMVVSIITGIIKTFFTLILIVPGIMAMIALSQVYYILAENPKLGIFKVITLSNKITKGYKGDLLKLSFSFTPLFLIPTAIALVIHVMVGHFWFVLPFLMGLFLLIITPYFHITFAIAYRALKLNALEDGVVSYADFGQDTPSAPEFPLIQKNTENSVGMLPSADTSKKKKKDKKKEKKLKKSKDEEVDKSEKKKKKKSKSEKKAKKKVN